MKYKHQARSIKQTNSLKGARILKPIAFFLTSALCTLSSGKAAFIYPLNDLKVIEVPISQSGLTRITVKGDRIANVFGISGEYVMEPDEAQGQVFIRPLESALNPISITLTTEGGHTQDLRLVPKNQAPEALILKAEDESKNAGEVKKNGSRSALNDNITRDEIEELLYACLENHIPQGYKEISLEIPKPHEMHHLKREIQNTKLRGLTFEVKNLASIPWILAESGFVDSLDMDVVAILMPKKLLTPGERMHVHVAVRSH